MPTATSRYATPVPAVLVIADDLKLVESLRGAFGSGCRVFLTPHIVTGLERVRDENLRVVLLHLGAARLNAPDAIQRVRVAHPAVKLLGLLPADATDEPGGCEIVRLPLDWRALRTLLTPAMEGRVELYKGPVAKPAEVKEPAPDVKEAEVKPAAVPLVTEPPDNEGPEIIMLPEIPDLEPAPSTTAPAVVEKPVSKPEPEPAPPTTFLRDGAVQLEQANWFEAQNHGDGQHIAGRVLRASAKQVVCEVLNPRQLLAAGWRTEQAVIHLARAEVYRGPARLTAVVNTGRSLICEWALPDPWHAALPDAAPSPVREELEPFHQRVRLLERLSPAFKSAVADLVALLEEAKQCMDRIEATLPMAPGKNRAEALRALLPELGQGLFPAFNAAFTRFEQACEAIPPELEAEHHSLVRQQLHPLLLCAPFIHHIYAKPLGYAGDYAALLQLLDDPYQGQSLYARLVNAWLVLSPAGEAYRHRLALLGRELAAEAARCSRAGHGLRVLSLGCGAASEIARFMAEDDLSSCAEFTLVDFNAETLAAAREQVSQAQQQHWRFCPVQYHQTTLQALVADIVRMKRRGLRSHGAVARAAGYDFIHCTGLFDYFSDRVCRRLLAAMQTLLAPGGRLIVCNFAPANPIRHFMRYILDWTLIHRSGAQLLGLAEAGPGWQSELSEAPQGVEAYLHLRKTGP